MRSLLLVLLLLSAAAGVSAQLLEMSLIRESLGTGVPVPARDTAFGEIAPPETHREIYRSAESWLLAGDTSAVSSMRRAVLERPSDGIRLRLGIPEPAGSVLQVPVRLFLFDRSSRVYQLVLRADDNSAYPWSVIDWYAQQETLPE